MRRLARGFRLLGDSWEVLKADSELLETSWAFSQDDLAGAFAPRRRSLG